MTADDSVDPTVAEGTDRRTALKKAAIAAGVVAWTTPAVQAVTARPAFAQNVTACAAKVLSISAILTGPNCKQCPGVPGIPGCCSGNTYFLSVINATCGPTCPGDATVGDIEIIGGTKPGKCNVDRFLDDACKTATVVIKANIKCADGTVQTVTNTVPITCNECGPLLDTELSTTDVIEDELIEQPPDTVAAGGGATDAPTEQLAPSGQDPPVDQPAGTVPAGGESPPAGGESPPGDTPRSGSSP